MESLRSHYEGVGESKNRIAWSTDTIENAHYRIEHTYFLEKFSTKLFEASTVLNNNGETH